VSSLIIDEVAIGRTLRVRVRVRRLGVRVRVRVG
jgi:hypothetical protein